MTEKKKHKVVSEKQILRSQEIIRRSDQNTFFHKTDRLYDSGDPIVEYMIYHHEEKGWLCDCLSFVFNLKDKNHAHTPDCIHIRAIKTKYNIQ
jgi:hypothetical protein